MDIENQDQAPTILKSQGKIAGRLASNTMDVDTDNEIVINRLTAAYTNEDAPFQVAKRSYERQYAQLYFSRLQLMKGPLKAAAAAKWPGLDMVPILEVGDRAEGRPCCVIGTLYKDMKLKPSILDEYTKDRGLKAALAATSFCSPDDSVVLEDEGARMTLTATQPEVLPVEQLATGLVVAVRGENSLNGEFAVQEILFPGMAEQPPRPVIEEDMYCAFISGLKLSNPQSDALQLSLAFDMLMGYSGSPAEQELASKVVRLVMAGGCLGNLDMLAAPPSAANQYGRQQQVALQPIKDLDMHLSELCAAIPVDIMPGPEDPANVALPQQPLHRCLLSGAVRSPALVRATNPHAFTLGGLHILGHSGQPLDDLCKYSTHPDRASALAASLEWRHLAPTAPDTLATYPFHDDDPFIISSTPHVLFAGNQPEYETKVVQGSHGQSVRVICVPSFAKTSCMVLLNLRTLEPRPIYFQGVSS